MNALGVASAAFVISLLLFTSRVCERCLVVVLRMVSLEVPTVDHRSAGGVSHPELKRLSFGTWTVTLVDCLLIALVVCCLRLLCRVQDAIRYN